MKTAEKEIYFLMYLNFVILILLMKTKDHECKHSYFLYISDIANIKTQMVKGIGNAAVF